ncbi:MAG: hypothetical protein AB1646_14270 [Thermodesulfobacteriota bacterium]
MMTSVDTTREQVIRKVLAGEKWGVSRDALSPEQAAEQGKVLLGKQWVDEQEFLVLPEVLRVRRSIRVRFGFGVVASVLFLSFVLIPYLASCRSGVEPVVFSVILGLVSFAAILSAILWEGLYRSQSWARSGMICFCLILSSVMVVLTLAAFWAVGSRDLHAVAYFALFFVLPCVLILAWIIRPLFNPTAKEMFRVQGLLSGEDRGKKRDVLRWIRPAAVVVIVLSNVHLGRSYQQWWATRPIHGCDRMALADVSKLAASLERLGVELEDAQCESKSDPFAKGLKLDWLVGPYYGWAGPGAKCGVLIRLEGDEVWACALRGSRPAGIESRYIHRIKVSGGADLPATHGPCFGQAYGGKEGKCYTSTAICDKCRMCEPQEWIKCRDVTN